MKHDINSQVANCPYCINRDKSNGCGYLDNLKSSRKALRHLSAGDELTRLSRMTHGMIKPTQPAGTDVPILTKQPPTDLNLRMADQDAEFVRAALVELYHQPRPVREERGSTIVWKVQHHLSLAETLKELRRNYEWEGMEGQTAQLIQKCRLCQREAKEPPVWKKPATDPQASVKRQLPGKITRPPQQTNNRCTPKVERIVELPRSNRTAFVGFTIPQLIAPNEPTQQVPRRVYVPEDLRGHLINFYNVESEGVHLSALHLQNTTRFALSTVPQRSLGNG